MEEEDFTEKMARMVMFFAKERERRDTAQQAVESWFKKSIISVRNMSLLWEEPTIRLGKSQQSKTRKSQGKDQIG